MRGWLAGLLLCLATPAAAQMDAPAPVLVEAAVVRDGDAWIADLRFLRDAPAWVFVHSALTAEGEQRPWRPQSWTVDTPGVRLERHGRYDVLVADEGEVPRRVRVRFTPFTQDLIAAYDPALVFTDGSVALYSEQFDAFPYESAPAAARLPADLATTDIPLNRTRVTFRDANGQVLHAGRRVASVTVDDDDGTYVLFGPAEPIVTDAMVAIVDPQLPEWIRGALNRSIPQIVDGYAAALGPAPGPKPTIIVSWGGPTPGRSSMGGSVLPGIVTMAYDGVGMLRESPEARSSGLWFIAHESAHFWLGQAVTYQYSRDAWIFEGGADLLAFRTVATADPAYDWRAAIDASIAECVSLSRGRGVASAEERNEQRAYYTCGMVFGLVAEAASRRPFVAFVRTLIDANREDRIVERAEWLAALDRVSGDPSLRRDIEAMLDRGADDPKAAIASLFTRAGVPFRLDDNGMPRMQ